MAIEHGGTVSIKEIKYRERQRKEYDQDYIKELALSLKQRGLMHPPVLDTEGYLVAGMNRILAAQQLGWTEIPFRVTSELDPLELKSIELEENIKRKDLTWFEQMAAVAEIHDLQQALAAQRGEKWNVAQTAQLIGKSVGTVSNATNVVAAAKEDPTVKEADSVTSALKKHQTKKQIERRAAEIQLKNQGKVKQIPANILQGDSRELIRQEADETFDAIVTNFPFGVDYQTKGGKQVYKDEEDYIVKLVRDITHQSFRVLKNDSWMVAFFDIRKITYSNKQKQLLKFIQENLNIPDEVNGAFSELAAESLGLAHWFEEAGFSWVSLVPHIWAKPNKTQGNIGDPKKGHIVAAEAFIWAAKGDPALLKQGGQNIIVHDTLTSGARDFEMQMPVPVCKSILQRVALGGSLILDPFAGVGSFGEAALELQMQFRGYELNKERAKLGNMRLAESVLGLIKPARGSHAAAPAQEA